MSFGRLSTQFVNALANAEQPPVPVYLETSGKVNEGFYSRKGNFEVTCRKVLEKPGSNGNQVAPEEQPFTANGGACGMTRPAGAELLPPREEEMQR